MASPARVIHSNVARLKSMLPVASYLHLLHQGAMTGFLPRFTPEGRPTGQFDNLSPRDRTDLARYLLDKVLPDAPKELALVSAPPSDADALNPAVLRHLTTDELRRIANPEKEETLDLDTAPADAAPVAVPVAPSEAGVGAA
jgi:hypothetical protein